jgi:hypothetical protein
MLAEIFMVRSEAEARSVGEVLPTSRSPFIPLSACRQFVFKEADPKGKEASSEDRLATSGPVTKRNERASVKQDSRYGM